MYNPVSGMTNLPYLYVGFSVIWIIITWLIGCIKVTFCKTHITGLLLPTLLFNCCQTALSIDAQSLGNTSLPRLHFLNYCPIHFCIHCDYPLTILPIYLMSHQSATPAFPSMPHHTLLLLLSYSLSLRPTVPNWIFN